MVPIYSFYEIAEFGIGQAAFESMLHEDFGVEKWMECVMDTRKQFVISLLGMSPPRSFFINIYFKFILILRCVGNTRSAGCDGTDAASDAVRVAGRGCGMRARLW